MLLVVVFFLCIPRPPRSKRTDTLFPYTTLFRSAHRGMKAKTIKAILAKKFNSFASSIEDEVVRKLVEKNTIITGGCIASMLLGEKINDFDLYFTDHATTKAVAEYYV